VIEIEIDEFQVFSEPFEQKALLSLYMTGVFKGCCCFVSSNLGYSENIESNILIFLPAYRFITFAICEISFSNFCKNESKIKTNYLKCFENQKNDSYSFFIFETFFIEIESRFTNFLRNEIVSRINIGNPKVKSESNSFFQAREKGKEQEETETSFFLENENTGPGNEVNQFRQLLRMSGGSNSGSDSNFSTPMSVDSKQIKINYQEMEKNDFKKLKSLSVICFSSDSDVKIIDGFVQFKSLCEIEIPSSVETIEENGFTGCILLTNIIFLWDSQIKVIRGFKGCTSLSRIEFPSSLEVIDKFSFERCTSLNEIIFSSDSHVKRIEGFNGCTSLSRIEIPSSVEVIGDYGFGRCVSLQKIIFLTGSSMRKIDGFQRCTSLCRIELPSSLEIIGHFGFSGCILLRFVINHAGCRLQGNGFFQRMRPFVGYEESEMKRNRGFVHLGSLY
jgi:hypothetical protein